MDIIILIAIIMYQFSYLIPYVPQKYNATEKEKEYRNLVIDFKNNKQVKLVASMVIRWIFSNYYRSRRKLTFICIPASSNERNIERFKDFSEFICARTGMKNGFQYVKIEGERKPQHMWHHFRPMDNTYKVTIDPEIGKANVLIFDADVIDNVIAVMHDRNYRASKVAV